MGMEMETETGTLGWRACFGVYALMFFFFRWSDVISGAVCFVS
jgi:hypothetical protein